MDRINRLGYAGGSAQRMEPYPRPVKHDTRHDHEVKAAAEQESILEEDYIPGHSQTIDTQMYKGPYDDSQSSIVLYASPIISDSATPDACVDAEILNTQTPVPHSMRSEECEYIGELQSPGYSLHSHCFSPNGQWLAVASLHKCEIRLYNPATLEHVLSFERKTTDNGYERLCFSPNGEYIIASGCDTIYVWKLDEAFDPYKIISKSTHYSYCVALSSDANWIVHSQNPQSESPSGHRLYLSNITQLNQPSFSLASNPDGIHPIFIRDEWLACASENVVHLYLLQNAKRTQKELKHAIKKITALAVSSDGKCLAVAGINDGPATLSLWQIGGLNSFPSKPFHILHGSIHTIKRIVFFADNSWLACAGINSKNEHIIEIFSVESGAYLGPIKPDLPIQDITVHESGTRRTLTMRSFDKFYCLTLPFNLNSAAIDKPRNTFNTVINAGRTPFLGPL